MKQAQEQDEQEDEQEEETSHKAHNKEDVFQQVHEEEHQDTHRRLTECPTFSGWARSLGCTPRPRKSPQTCIEGRTQEDENTCNKEKDVQNVIEQHWIANKKSDRQFVTLV